METFRNVHKKERLTQYQLCTIYSYIYISAQVNWTIVHMLFRNFSCLTMDC